MVNPIEIPENVHNPESGSDHQQTSRQLTTNQRNNKKNYQQDKRTNGQRAKNKYCKKCVFNILYFQCSNVKNVKIFKKRKLT